MPRVAVDVMLKRRSWTRRARRWSGPCPRSGSTASPTSASASTSSSPSATATASRRPDGWPRPCWPTRSSRSSRCASCHNERPKVARQLSLPSGRPPQRSPGPPRGRFRRPRLPVIGRPRRLNQEEVAALKARPWPRLPWWLWLAVAVTTVAMVVVATGLFGSVPDQLPVAARRSPPTPELSHGVGDIRVPVLERRNQGLLVRRHPGCPRLDRVTLVGTTAEVALLDAAADQLCALRSTTPIQRARDGLQQAAATVEFAEFELSINESTTDFATGRPTVMVHAKFQQGAAAPERVAVVLVHEGTHVADGGPPTAAAELAARRAELDACGRLFTGGAQPNRGCADAAALLATDDAGALARLKEAGYR